MHILPNRTMRLAGQRVEAGKVVEVTKEAGDLAVRHGWAVEMVSPKKPRSSGATSSGEVAPGPTGPDA